jgi:aspartyl protease family protein
MTNPTQPSNHRIGIVMSFLSAIIVLALLTAFFNRELDQQKNPNQDILTAQTSQGGLEIVLQRNRAGHYVLNGEINQQSVVFMLDTGASDVVIPLHLAQQLGLQKQHAVIYQTANGQVRGHRTQISELKLGDIRLQNIRAGINPGMHENIILLGMSALKNLHFSQQGNELRIQQY